MGRLIGVGGIVFLEYEIRAGSFQKDFYKVCAVRIIIDDQNPSFSCVCWARDGIRRGESVPDAGGKKSASSNFFMICPCA